MTEEQGRCSKGHVCCTDPSLYHDHFLRPEECPMCLSRKARERDRHAR